jgi:hypothetical protein
MLIVDITVVQVALRTLGTTSGSVARHRSELVTEVGVADLGKLDDADYPASSPDRPRGCWARRKRSCAAWTPRTSCAPNAQAAGTPMLALPTHPRSTATRQLDEGQALVAAARIIGLQDQLTVAENVSSRYLAITAGSAHLDPYCLTKRHIGYRSIYLARYGRDVSSTRLSGISLHPDELNISHQRSNADGHHTSSLTSTANCRSTNTEGSWWECFEERDLLAAELAMAADPLPRHRTAGSRSRSSPGC